MRIAETNSVYDLSFYEKRTLIPAGSWVFAGPEGYAEILLPGDTQVALHGRGTGVVGSESRREPIFTLLDVTGATVSFGEAGQVELPGGAILEGSSGPFGWRRSTIDSSGFGTAPTRSPSWITATRSSASSRARPSSWRSSATSRRPSSWTPRPARWIHPRGEIALRGQVEVLSAGSGSVLRATGTSEVEGLGLRLELDPGDEVRLESLGPASSDQ